MRKAYPEDLRQPEQPLNGLNFMSTRTGKNGLAARTRYCVFALKSVKKLRLLPSCCVLLL